MLEAYLTKLGERGLLDGFLDVLVYVIFGETPHAIPAELSEKKSNNLFHFVSPIISFLIIFYIHADKKPLTLDELVTRSGLKQLYKSVRVPFAIDPDESYSKPNSTNNKSNNKKKKSNRSNNITNQDTNDFDSNDNDAGGAGADDNDDQEFDMDE